MPLTLMYITNDPGVARIAEDNGVDWIFVDLEIIGKHERQGHLDTVISHHTIDDVASLRRVLSRSQLLVRLNPIHDGSRTEIDSVIEAGADIVMLPFFTERAEVETFVGMVAGRSKVCLLVETPSAAESLEDILTVGGIDFVHIGLNDLHLAYGRPFMFELLADGTVEGLASIAQSAGIPFGFGGVARIGNGDLSAEAIIAEHYRLGSSQVILSRAFCDAADEPSNFAVSEVFAREIPRIRRFEASLLTESDEFFASNREEVIRSVEFIRARKAGASVEQISLSEETVLPGSLVGQGAQR